MSRGAGIDLLILQSLKAPHCSPGINCSVRRNRHSCGACRRRRRMCNTAFRLSREATMLLSGFTAADPYRHTP